jgi:DUF971 family protein
MAGRLSPLNIAAIGQELAIAWSDGRESYIALDVLRRSCPCAACCGEPDAMGNVVKPEVRLTPDSFELRGWKIVGGYAVQPAWGDGHATGLYTFPHLRKIAGTD